MKYKAPSQPQLFWSLPLAGHPDKAVDISFAEFRRKKTGGVYTLTEALCYVATRAPELRVKFAASHSHRG
jgi:hypothetical protein